MHQAIIKLLRFAGHLLLVESPSLLYLLYIVFVSLPFWHVISILFLVHFSIISSNRKHKILLCTCNSILYMRFCYSNFLQLITSFHYLTYLRLHYINYSSCLSLPPIHHHRPMMLLMSFCSWYLLDHMVDIFEFGISAASFWLSRGFVYYYNIFLKISRNI